MQLIEKYLDKASALDIWVEQARNIVQTVVVVDQNVTNSSSNTDAAHITLLLLELSLRVLRTMSRKSAYATEIKVFGWTSFSRTDHVLVLGFRRYHVIATYVSKAISGSSPVDLQR